MKQDIYAIINHYKKFYPEFTYESLKTTITGILERHENIDAITLDFYLNPIEAGGLGYGIRYSKGRKERW